MTPAKQVVRSPMPLLYKYRSLANFKHFIDIVVNGRLYAAQYFDLNDPMEGHYLYSSAGELDIQMRDLLKGEKEKIRILSLSRKPDIALMWAHYADGNKGVAIGVQVDARKHESRPVDYTGLASVNLLRSHASTAIDILSHKLPAWSYEEEERIFVKHGSYVAVSVKEVILGNRMSKQDKNLVRNTVNLLLPYASVIEQPNGSALI